MPSKVNNLLQEVDKPQFKLTAWDNYKDTALQASKEPIKPLSSHELIRVDELAGIVYDEIRANPRDIIMIAQNTGMREIEIERIKNHLFCNDHLLSYSSIRMRFDPDPLIVVSWKRLEEGNFTPDDIILLNHEIFESKFEGIFKTDYDTAHKAANNSNKNRESPLEKLTTEQRDEIYRGFLNSYGKK